MDGAKMTASELADHLATEWIKHEKDVGILMKTSAEFLYTQITMLRQQQAEIEALKQIIDANNLNQNIGQFVKPTNEPVAYVDPIWMDRPDLVMSHQLEIGKLFARTQFKNYVPLYTHLADTIPYKDLHQMVKNVLAHPVKELTDEEIKFIAYPDLHHHSP